MALRHYTGSIKPTSAVWKCPTCGTENQGPLEQGCTACKAGADAQARAATPTATAPVLPVRKPVSVQQAYVRWLAAEEGEPTLEMAFIAGATWQKVEGKALGLVDAPIAPPTAAPESQGGWTVALVPPDTKEPALADSRTEQTIRAALAFYRDNQLAYGPVPGQLSAEETTELIKRLTPKESEQ